MRRRRCFALRLAFVFGIILAVTVRDDTPVLAAVAAADLVALAGAVISCRGLRRSG